MARDCFCVHFVSANRHAYSEAVLVGAVTRAGRRRLDVYECDVFGEVTLARCLNCLFRTPEASSSEAVKDAKGTGRVRGRRDAGLSGGSA